MHPIIEIIEKKRRTSKRSVYALIADRKDTMRDIVVRYISLIQRRYTPLSQAAVYTSSQYRHHYFRRIPNVKFFSPRKPNNIRGQTFQQIIIDNADKFSPSVPYYRGPFTLIPQAAFPTLPETGGILIILGNPSRPGHNHLRHFWNQVQKFGRYLFIDPARLAARAEKLKEQTLTVQLRHSQTNKYHFIYLPYINNINLTHPLPDCASPQKIPCSITQTKILTSAPRLRA